MKKKIYIDYDFSKLKIILNELNIKQEDFLKYNCPISRTTIDKLYRSENTELITIEYIIMALNIINPNKIYTIDDICTFKINNDAKIIEDIERYNKMKGR